MTTVGAEWPEVRVGDLGTVITGRTPPTERPKYFGYRFPFITPGDMRQGKYARLTERSLSDEGAALLDRIKLPANSVCVSCIGWQMGETIMTANTSFSNQQINTVIPGKQINASFLYYSLKPRKQELLSIGSGTGVRTPILNKSAFCNLKIKVPRLPEQHRIASILSAYDDLIEANQRRVAILEEMARRLFEEWFVHLRFPGHAGIPLHDTPNGPVPEGWMPTTLESLIRLEYGRALKVDQRVPGHVAVIGSSGVVGLHNFSLVSGPCVIVGRKGNAGAVIWSPTDCYPIDTTFYVTTSKPIHYVFHQLQHLTFQTGDTAVPGLNRDSAHRAPIVMPPNSLLSRFNDAVAPFVEMRDHLNGTNVRLAAARDLLLPRLLSGQISVAQDQVPTLLAAE